MACGLFDAESFMVARPGWEACRWEDDVQCWPSELQWYGSLVQAADVTDDLQDMERRVYLDIVMVDPAAFSSGTSQCRGAGLGNAQHNAHCLVPCA